MVLLRSGSGSGQRDSNYPRVRFVVSAPGLLPLEDPEIKQEGDTQGVVAADQREAVFDSGAFLDGDSRERRSNRNTAS